MNGSTMIGEHQSRGENADAERRSLEQRADQRQLAQVFDQPGLHVLLQQRREHEQAPDAVDDAGHAGQQFDGDAHRPAQPARARARSGTPRRRS